MGLCSFWDLQAFLHTHMVVEIPQSCRTAALSSCSLPHAPCPRPSTDSSHHSSLSCQGSCDQVIPPVPRHKSLCRCKGGVGEAPQELCMHPTLDLHTTPKQKKDLMGVISNKSCNTMPEKWPGHKATCHTTNQQPEWKKIIKRHQRWDYLEVGINLTSI